MKAIKNWEYLQVVCSDQNEVNKALTIYPNFSHSIKGVVSEQILFFKATE